MAIKAITTPLRSTVAPPIPPAAELYEPLAKAVLRRRLTHRIFPYTFLFATAGSWIWLFWNGRFALTRLFATSFTLWAVGILPVILLRKRFLTVTHTTGPSPLVLVQKSVAPPLRARTLRAVQTYLFSALCMLVLNANIDGTIPIFIKSRKHTYTPHPVFVLLALTQCSLAILYSLRSLLRDVWLFPFRRPTLTPSPSAILGPVLLPLLALPVALALLFVVIPLLRRLPILSLLLRPILYPRASVLRSVGRAWSLGIQTMGAWEVGAAIWGWSIGEPLRTTTSVRALVSGISVARTPAPASSSSILSTPFRSSAFHSPAPATTPFEVSISIYTHLAYAELLALAAAPPSDAGAAQARAEAFDVEGLVWARLARETLVLIGGEYQVLLRRGREPPPPPPPAPPLPSSPADGGTKAGPWAIKASPLLKENIFAAPGKTAPRSPAKRLADALASGGAVEEVVAPALESLAVPDVDLRRYVPDLPVLRLPAWVERGARVSLPKAWTHPRAERAVAEWVPRREVCVAAIGVLSHLTCASLAEDRYGVVQRDIPRVLEALCEFLGAVEEAREGLRLPAAATGEGEGEKAAKAVLEEADLVRARAVLGDVEDALKEGVARIVRTFGDRLRAFRFPPRTAGRLQGFVDYCA